MANAFGTAAVALVNCPACRKLHIELVGADDGAGYRAVAATGALDRVHKARVLAQPHGEIARLARDALDLGHRQNINVEVAAGLDQLGRHDAHRAVVGREGLVELRHRPADGRACIREIDLEAGIGQVERCLHPTDARAHHEHGPNFFVSVPREVCHLSPSLVVAVAFDRASFNR
jgi:hypothetical protein